MSKLKLCKDCKHLMNKDRCNSPNIPSDPITGKRGTVPAWINRAFWFRCYEDANWFEPKEPAVSTWKKFLRLFKGSHDQT